MSNTSQIPAIAAKFDATNQPVQSSVAASSDKYKIIVKNKNWISAFSEKVNGNTYYTRIFDFGSVNTIDSFYVVLQGLHDSAYSDISNRVAGMSTIDISGWENADVTEMIDISSFYNATRTQDYHQIYTQNPFNVADSKNSYLHNIQMKYVDVNEEATTGTGIDRLYTGNSVKKLFIKITYRLKSDEELPVGNDSFANAALINLPTLSTSFSVFNNGGNTAFNFIPGSDDYYEFSLDLSKTYELQLFDNSPDSASRNNFGLGFELYLKSVDTTQDPILYKSVTYTDKDDNLNSYAGNLIDKQFENSDANSVKTFYLKVVSNIKSYFYGIRIKVSTSPTLTTNILTFTILDTNYNLLTTDERNNLKSIIRGMVRDAVSNDSVVDASMEVVLERVITFNGDKNILATVILGQVPLGEIQAIVDIFASTITFTFEEDSELESNQVTKNINNPTANTISINNKPTDTIPVSDGDSNPTIPSSNDFTAKDVFTLMKANYLGGEVNMHQFPQNSGLVTYFDKYCHTSIKTTDGKILYCYFSLNMSTSTTGTISQNLVLKVFYRSGVSADVVVDNLSYSVISELNDYPFNILNQNNKIVVLYGIKDGTSKNLCCKQYTASVTVDNTVSIVKTNFEYSLKASEAAAAAAGGTNNYDKKQKSVNKYNTGFVDNNHNLYFYEINFSITSGNNTISIIKLNESFTKTSISSVGYYDGTIYRLYHPEDRFTETNYLYLMGENQLGGSSYVSNSVFRFNKNQIPDIYQFNTSKLPDMLGVIKPDGSLYFKNTDSSTSSIQSDFVNFQMILSQR